MTFTKKLALLQQYEEDYEWYPTTDEIIEAAKKDLLDYGIQHKHTLRRSEIRPHYQYVNEGRQKEYSLDIETMLDVGAGDGRVLQAFDAQKKYGIEIARAQADDLIKKGIFLIGRDFRNVDLMLTKYGVIFCNPPYSAYENWVHTIITTANFEVLYLVIPTRWENTELKKTISQYYEYIVIGEYDFTHAEREARARVHLIRVNAKWIKTINRDGNRSDMDCQETIADSFSRWVTEHIADFSEVKEEAYQEQEARELILKQTPIEQLLDDYEVEKQNLFEAFKIIGHLPCDVIKMMGQDKNSMLEILRKSISGLKLKYWKAAFSQLDPVKTRMTRKMREHIFDRIREFGSLDFNTENVYSIIIWIINNTNAGIVEQIEDVFDRLTEPDYMKAYKSNTHWIKDDWRYADGKPEKYQIGLDYRIITHCFEIQYQYSHNPTVVDDFIVICNNLGFKIKDCCIPNYNLHSTKQEFYTEDGTLAFTMRFYVGNKNAHLKINKHILLKFNIEVAKIRKWIRSADDIQEEFELSEQEAAQFWKSGLQLIGNNDIKLLEKKRSRQW